MSTIQEIIYCVKCKAKQIVKDIEKVTFSNGRPALKAKCTVCGTTVCKIVSKAK